LSDERRVAVGRVGRPHGYDGSFWVASPTSTLEVGTVVRVGDLEARIERRGGTDERPLLRLTGVTDKESAAALRGQSLTVPEAESPLAEGEWLVSDLVGCAIPGVGEVTRVIAAPSCDVLEAGPDGVLIPLVSDAIESIDIEARTIEVDREFLGLGQGGPSATGGDGG
jgi:16S rRNA processing protein RimM